MRVSYRLRIFLLLTLLFAGTSVAWSLIRWETHAPEREAWASVSAAMTRQKARIDSLEAEIGALQDRVGQERAEMEGSSRRIGHYEGGARNGRLPTPRYRAYMGEIDRHNEIVQRHNEDVVELQAIYQEYSELVDLHNALIDSANSMQRRAAEEGYQLPEPEIR